METGKCRDCGLELDLCDFCKCAGDECIYTCPRDLGGCGAVERVEIIKEESREKREGGKP